VSSSRVKLEKTPYLANRVIRESSNQARELWPLQLACTLQEPVRCVFSPHFCALDGSVSPWVCHLRDRKGPGAL